MLPQGPGRTQALLQARRELGGGPAREGVVRVKETASDAQLWGDQVCVGGLSSPLGLEGPAGPLKQGHRAACGLGVRA